MSWVKDVWKEKPRREALRIGKIWLACYKFSAPRKARNRLFGDNQLHKQAGSAFWTSSVCSGSASTAPMRHKIKALHPWRGLQKGTSPIKKKTIMSGLSFSVNCRMQLWDKWEHGMVLWVCEKHCWKCQNCSIQQFWSENLGFSWSGIIRVF